MAITAKASDDGKKLLIEVDLAEPHEIKLSGTGKTWLVGGGSPTKTGAKIEHQGAKREVTVQLSAFIPRLEEDKVPDGSPAFSGKSSKKDTAGATGKENTPAAGGGKKAASKH